jgi:HEPN pEK499 p136
MNQISVVPFITAVRQTNGMLQLLDAEKNNPSITLGELQQKFVSQFSVHPSNEDFAFYNQYQFLTSLFAYLCYPSEKFYDELPDIAISSLVSGWGTVNLAFNGSVKNLVRHLRNSISHGHFSVSPELIFEFRNREVTVIFDHVKLHKFCQALAHWCITKDISLATLRR